jgi:hypothetical protein
MARFAVSTESKSKLGLWVSRRVREIGVRVRALDDEKLGGEVAERRACREEREGREDGFAELRPRPDSDYARTSAYAGRKPEYGRKPACNVGRNSQLQIGRAT